MVKHGVSKPRASSSPIPPLLPTASPILPTPAPIPLSQPKQSYAQVLNSSATSSASSIRSSVSTATTAPQSCRYCVRNIPLSFKTQKQFFQTIVTLNIPLTNLKLNYNRTALLETSSPLPANLERKIQHLLGDPAVTLTQLAGPRSIIHASKPQSMSCVIRNVDTDITDTEILDAISLPKVLKVVRIVSRATRTPSSFVRVITHSRSTIDFLLAKGVLMFGRRYPCEPSHIPNPVPKYCSTCTKVGHLSEDCPTRALTCPICGEKHKSIACKAPSPKCNNCAGSHPTYSFDCPLRIALPKFPEEAAPAQILNTTSDTSSSSSSKPDDPDVEHFLRINRFLRTLTISLINIFPDKRNLVCSSIDNASRVLLGRRMLANFSGQHVHFSTPLV